MKGKMNGAGKINDRFRVLKSSRLKSIPNSWCVHLLASDPTGTGTNSCQRCFNQEVRGQKNVIHGWSRLREDFGANKM